MANHDHRITPDKEFDYRELFYGHDLPIACFLSATIAGLQFKNLGYYSGRIGQLTGEDGKFAIKVEWGLFIISTFIVLFIWVSGAEVE